MRNNDSIDLTNPSYLCVKDLNYILNDFKNLPLTIYNNKAQTLSHQKMLLQPR